MKKKGEKTMKNICDNCGKELIYIAAQVNFGYGSNFDEDKLNFCSDKCLKQWIDKNISGEEEGGEKMSEKEKERESIRMLRKLSLDLKGFSLRFGGYIKAESVSHEIDYWLDVYDEEKKELRKK